MGNDYFDQFLPGTDPCDAAIEERRLFPRIQIPTEFQPRIAVVGQAGYISAITERGLFIRTDYACPSGAVLHINLDAADSLALRCVVRNRTREGVGVEVFDPSEETLARMRTFIERLKARIG